MIPSLRRFVPAVGMAIALIVVAATREGWRPRTSDVGPLLTVINIAGLSWDRLTPLSHTGRMPNLDTLTARGGAAGDILAKDFPTRTSILASLITGCWPRRHGITEPGDLSKCYSGRGRTPVWRYLAEAGQPCVVAGFPLVFPQEHPDNRVVPQASSLGSPLPPGLPELPGLVTGGKVLPGNLGKALADCLATDLGIVAAARIAVLDGGRFHFFLRLPGLGLWEEALRDALPEAERDTLAEGYYLALDEMLGEVLAWRGHEGTIFLVSEAGNLAGRPAQRRDFPVIERYPSFGFLWATGFGIRRGISSVTMQPPDLTTTLLYVAGLPIPRNQDGRVAFGLLGEDFYFKHPLTFR